MRDHRGTGLKRVRFECRIIGRHARSQSLARVIIRAQILLESMIKIYMFATQHNLQFQIIDNVFVTISPMSNLADIKLIKKFKIDKYNINQIKVVIDEIM